MVNPIFLQAQAMMDWRVTPTEWDALTPDDKAFMMATTRVRHGMEAWEAEQSRRKAKRGR